MNLDAETVSKSKFKVLYRKNNALFTVRIKFEI
jgi:hypothetical protein